MNQKKPSHNCHTDVHSKNLRTARIDGTVKLVTQIWDVVSYACAGARIMRIMHMDNHVLFFRNELHRLVKLRWL
jgi:hypothetical protein